MSNGDFFIDLWQRHERLPKGPKADLRRVASPDEVRLIAAGYQLFPGRPLTLGKLRLLFCLPWLRHKQDAGPLGAALAKAGIDEQRLFQIVRSEAPNDIVQLRRLLQRAEPVVDAGVVGKQLLYWHESDKRRLLENYYLAWNEPART